MKKEIGTVVDVFTAIAVVAGIMMLVRPGSRGPGLVRALGDAWVGAANGTIGAQLTGQTGSSSWRTKKGGSSSGGGTGSSGDSPGLSVPLLPILPIGPKIHLPSWTNPDNW